MRGFYFSQGISKERNIIISGQVMAALMRDSSDKDNGVGDVVTAKVWHLIYRMFCWSEIPFRRLWPSAACGGKGLPPYR
jgi:hypothetical protein